MRVVSRRRRFAVPPTQHERFNTRGRKRIAPERRCPHRSCDSPRGSSRTLFSRDAPHPPTEEVQRAPGGSKCHVRARMLIAPFPQRSSRNTRLRGAPTAQVQTETHQSHCYERRPVLTHVNRQLYGASVVLFMYSTLLSLSRVALRGVLRTGSSGRPYRGSPAGGA
jgi:hypothetical protein